MRTSGPSSIVAQLRYLVGLQRQIRALARSLRVAARTSAVSDVLDAVFRTADSTLSLEPLQVRSELGRFLELVARDRPRRVLEIGTGTGGTLYLLAWASEPHARLLSLDLCIYPPERRRLYRSYSGRRRQIAGWEADSHDVDTRARIERYFDGQPLDLLFIDGDHGYESVARDYELYAPLVRPGGLIAFHDIVEGPREAVGEVPRFWREVRDSLADPEELVESWQQVGFGIGVGRRQVLS